MTLKETIASDITNVFLNTDESAYSAVWTPAGGVAQPAISVFFQNTPLHGDEYQGLPVEQPETYIVAKASDVSSWKARDHVTINSTQYQIINNPYPDSSDNYWSIIPLRLPRGQETKI